MNNSKSITFSHIGDNDQIEYMKVDFVKACRFKDDFAVSFYQLDYQGVVSALDGSSELNPEDVKPMPICKVVMNYETFKQMTAEMANIIGIYTKQQEDTK
jgi:hypothetical protein